MDISKDGRIKKSSREETTPISGSRSHVSRRLMDRDSHSKLDDRRQIHGRPVQAPQRDKAMEDARRQQEARRIENERHHQKDSRGQVSRYEHEKLAKMFDQVCANVRILQHDKEQMESRLLVDLEGRYMDEIKSLKMSLEETEGDRDSFRYKLSERKREVDRLNEQLACLGPNKEGSKKEVSRILQERDQLRTRLLDRKKENQMLQEKLSNANQMLESVKGDAPTDQRVNELQVQVSNLQHQNQLLQNEKDNLSDINNQLMRSIEIMESQLRETENERYRLNQSVTELRAASRERTLLSHGNSDEMLAIKRYRSSNPGIRTKSSQGSAEEGIDLMTRSDSGQTPLSGGQETTVPGMSRGRSLGKFSSSTSNLIGEGHLEKVPAHSRLSEQNSRLRLKVVRVEKALDDVKKEKQSLVDKIYKLEQESESKVQSMTIDLKKAQDDLVKSLSNVKNGQEQINLLTREKGVAMRDNAASYEQSIQKETQLRELQAEKQILEQQRDIANKERERVINELVGLKKKLETIKVQRQKDAKDLSLMRHLKGKAVQEVGELRRQVEDVQRNKEKLDEDLTNIQDTVRRAVVKLSPRQRHKSSGATNEDAGSSNVSKDLRDVVEQIGVLENERKVLLKKLFGLESSDQSQGRTLSDALRKIESLYHERDDLLLEIKALQQSSSQLNEERIYDLKQRIEDLLMEQDALSSRNTNLKREASMMSTKLVRAEQDRDRYAIEAERMQLECEKLKSTQARLVEEHTKTLERVNELWKQKWPVHWDEAWEEKHVTISLDSGGFAGFSVVGGRDQPQLPNPGAFIVTTVNQGGPAEGYLKVGDILESVNGINLSNADHREAVKVVKETKRALTIVLKRRRSAYPIQMGIVSAVNAVPHVAPSVGTGEESAENLEYSLYVTGKEKSDLGFKFDWSTVCTVVDVASSGPATQILEPGDRIVKINNSPIKHEKPSNIKKLLKPHKNILRLEIERAKKQDRSYMGQALPLPTTDSWPSESEPPSYKRMSWSQSGSSTPIRSKLPEEDSCTQQSMLPEPCPEPEQNRDTDEGAKGYSSRPLSRYHPRSRDSYSSRDSRDYSGDTESQDSGNKPTKLVSLVTGVKRNQDKQEDTHRHQQQSMQRPISDGVIYGNFNERRIEYEEVLLSERTDSQFSQSESYLSESSYDYGLSSSQSIDLTFHSYPNMPSHNRLTVDTVMTTQAPSQHSDEEDGVGFMARDDASRTTFRNRSVDSNSNGNNSEEIGDSEASQFTESQLTESQLSYQDSSSKSQEFVRGKSSIFKKRHHGYKSRHKKNNSFHGSHSLSKLSSSDQNLARGGLSNLAMRGRSRSNLSLGHAPSMSKLVEEPRRSTSTTNVSEYEHDPLADATYIRANFSYIPRTVKELSIKAADVFHIHDEAPPERFRASFWASRLSSVGTDEGVGAIPNSMRAQEYLDAQGEAIDTDLALYEEVEAFTGRRPVLVFGALCDQVVNSLLESYPKLFYACPTDFVEGAARITEARLGREVSEGKLIDFRRAEGGFELYKVEAITEPDSKNKHCLVVGSIQAFHTLKSIAPPITILVKAMTAESINTFSPEQIPPEQAKVMFEEVSLLEDNHAHEFSASLFLIYMDTLMGQIEDIVTKEKRKQAWVPITRET